MSKLTKTRTSLIIQSINSIGESALSNFDALAVIQEYISYLRVHEEEKTKREQIAARRDVLLAAINSEREIILTYFNHRFSERKAALDQLFLTLNEGVASKSTTVIDASLTGIINILQDNPLKDLNDFKRNMERPDFMIEL